jgi:hypothetical protein
MAIPAAPTATQNDHPKRGKSSKEVCAFTSFEDLIPYTAVPIPMLKTATNREAFCLDKTQPITYLGKTPLLY